MEVVSCQNERRSACFPWQRFRLPLVGGLIAPNQGFFPSYAGGRYELGNTTLIVSRGLARESTRVPRLFNRPELVVVDVEPPK